MNASTPSSTLIATSSRGRCSHCSHVVDVDKYGYAAGHTTYDNHFRAQVTCDGTQELTSVPRENPNRRGL